MLRTVSIATAMVASLGFAALAIAATAPKPALAARSERGSLPRFPDFGQLPPPEVITPDRVFRLAQDFPKALPPPEPAVQRILAIDFRKDWQGYMAATLAYILEGNIENRALSDTFFLEDNKARPWYHVPWQHWGDNGREGLHGLTAEGPVNPHVLNPLQQNQWAAYAVGFYNARGGYTIGQVWQDANNPRIDAVVRDGGFPIGTVVAKLLFTTAPVAEAPLLSNPIEWSAYVKDKFSAPGPTGLPINPRHLASVRLLQVDMMVRDPRADATGGWVFGTWIYNGLQAKVRAPGQTFDNRWRNLMPLGIAWGNDPTVTSFPGGNPAPLKTITNPDLKETVISTDPALPPMHLGYGLRLSGAVDNVESSCKSCHSAAQYPAISNILPGFSMKNGRYLTPKDPEWMRWFRNLKPTEAFDAGAVSTDNSLQLAGSIQNFLAAGNITSGGLYATQYYKGRKIESIYGSRGMTKHSK
ncbi:MAG: hypothetical protein H7251_17045 [Acetobacteraceae bacterium]|nr:hypothetical protein [Acetobacteraceae bacterium]